MMATCRLESGVFFRRDSSGRMVKHLPGDVFEASLRQIEVLGNKVSRLEEEKAPVVVPPASPEKELEPPATTGEPVPAGTLPSPEEPESSPETHDNSPEEPEVAERVGGGWYRLPDGSKVRKREAQSLGYRLE
jgi:hypothetical protein